MSSRTAPRSTARTAAVSSSRQCFLCGHRLRDTDQHQHIGRRLGCICLFHVECLVEAAIGGRNVCDCGATIGSEDTIRIIVPRNPPQDPATSRSLSPTNSVPDLRSFVQECPICSDSLDSGRAVCRPMTCQHSFHVSCLLETAFDRVRPRAHSAGHDSWFDRQSQCPLCRRDFPGVTPLPEGAAPSVLIHYESLETASGGLGGGCRNPQTQRQQTMDLLWAIGGAVAAVVAIFAVVLIRR